MKLLQPPPRPGFPQLGALWDHPALEQGVMASAPGHGQSSLQSPCADWRSSYARGRVWEMKDTWMRLSSPDRLTLGFTYLGCPQHPPAAIVTWPAQGPRTALAWGASSPLLQDVPSVLSQQELIPRGCGQLWGSFCLPGEPSSTPHPPCSPTAPSPLQGASQSSCPQWKQWPQPPTPGPIAGVSPTVGAQPCSPWCGFR